MEATNTPAAKRPKQTATKADIRIDPRTGKPLPLTEVKKKKAGPLKGVLVTFCVFLLLLVAAAGLLYFNVAGLRGMAISLMQGGSPYQSQINAIKQQNDQLNEAKLNFESDQQLFAAQVKQFEAEQKKFEKEKEALEKREAELNTREAMINQNALSAQSLAQIYETMEPDAAADVLMEMNNVAQMAQIIGNMSEEKAALVLEYMDANIASEITIELMRRQ